MPIVNTEDAGFYMGTGLVSTIIINNKKNHMQESKYSDHMRNDHKADNTEFRYEARNSELIYAQLLKFYVYGCLGINIRIPSPQT